MTACVSFPMYDLPGIEPLWDAWWSGLRRHLTVAGIEGLPAVLTRRPALMSYWSCPDTVLSQTCGYPYVFGLSGRWQLLATPCFETEWCSGPYYRNLVLVAENSRFETVADLHGASVAYNSADSHSGYNSFRSMIAPLAGDRRFFAGGVETGGHLQTMAAIRDGRADCGSVDCVTFALTAKHRPAEAAGLRVLDRGPAVPGLPLIVPRTAPAERVARFRAGVAAAFADPDLDDLRDELLLAGVSELTDADYTAIGVLDENARRAGFPALV